AILNHMVQYLADGSAACKGALTCRCTPLCRRQSLPCSGPISVDTLLATVKIAALAAMGGRGAGEPELEGRSRGDWLHGPDPFERLSSGTPLLSSGRQRRVGGRVLARRGQGTRIRRAMGLRLV